MIELKKINYEFSDLEPFINAQTVEIHHTKHHQTYVNNLNGLIEGTDLETLSLEEILKRVSTLDDSKRTPINNNAGGVYLHDNYFGQFSKSPSEVSGELKEKIETQFESFEKMITELKEKAVKQFGSGWSALAINKKTKNLEIIQIPNQDIAKFLENDIYPIVTLDVWEHAYYLQYQNLRPKYLDEMVKAIDWNIVANRYSEIIK